MCSACTVHVPVLFHGSTHPVCRAVHAFQGSEQCEHGTYYTIPPTASTIILAWLPTRITITSIQSNGYSSHTTVACPCGHVGSVWA